MTTRAYLIDVARSKIGDYRKGSKRVEALWREVMPPAASDAQIRQLAASADWCGVLTLACLREAKLTDAHWVLGSGYVLRVIGANAATKTPEPGDIGIIQRWPGATKDAWHHWIVSAWNGPNDWQSIDGNVPDCATREHDRVLPTTTFYSIQCLVRAMPEAGFLRDGEFSVPGVQDPK